ncbi:MAG: ATP-binding protein [Bdellovibrionales bacterium]
MAKRRIQICNQEELLGEIERLRNRLGFVEETLRAIHSDEVDAIIMQSPQGERVFAFEEAERPYRVLIEEMSEGAVCLNPDRAILYCNRFFEKLVGTETETLLGRKFIEFIAPEDLLLWKRFEDPELPRAATLRLVNSLGEAIPCRISLHRLQLQGTIDIGLIVTDLRERLVTEELLKQKIEEARAGSLMKDEFLATVSHELRTPLNVIAGHAKLLPRLPPQSAPFKNAIDAIVRNVQVQTRIVEDILDISKIVCGRLPLQQTRIEIHPLLEDVINSISAAAQRKSVQVELKVDSRSLELEGDEARIRQILWNLLSNAVKFTPDGGHVELSVWRASKHVEFAVTDTGEGISQEFLPFAFDRFTQEDGSSKRVHEGLGLGLAIVHYLVKAHGGAITAESAGKGKGARFTVRLPLCTGDGPNLSVVH